MALITDDISYENVEKMVPPGAIPPGDYVLALIESDYKKSNANSNNRYIQAVFQVMDGACKNRRIYINYNLKNDNTQAENIGRSHYNAFCEALNKNPKMVKDTTELHDILFCAKIGTKTGKDKDGNDTQQNIITQYMPYNSIEAANSRAAASKPTPSWGAPKSINTGVAPQQLPQQHVEQHIAYQSTQPPAHFDEIPYN